MILVNAFLALACATAPSGDELPVTGRDARALAPLDDLMKSFVADRGIPGAALAVARNGKLLYARGFGYSDVAAREPVDPAARFRIASVSKPLTAVTTLRLAERGSMKLDEKAFARLVPALQLDEEKCGDPRLNEITVLQLLQHRGGFDRGASFDPMFRSTEIVRELGVAAPAKPADVVRYMWTRRLDFAPGEKMAYSNFGYCALGRVIEVATGRDYETVVREEVLLPLGIRGMRIGATLSAARAPREVRYYVKGEPVTESVFDASGETKTPNPYGAWCLETMDAHGGWIASAPELVRFACALDRNAKPGLLSSKSLDALFAPPPSAPDSAATTPTTKDTKPPASWYACGFMVRPVGDRGQNHWHTGSLDGTSTLLVRRFDGFAWAVLFNTRDGDPASAIDSLIHGAVDRVKADEWPDRDLFPELLEAAADDRDRGK